jgi:hypothetical protein
MLVEQARPLLEGEQGDVGDPMSSLLDIDSLTQYQRHDSPWPDLSFRILTFS